MIHKILRLFLNILTVDEKNYLLDRGNLTQRIQVQLYQKQKAFSEFCFAFLKPISNFKHLPKKVIVIAGLFPEIHAPKNMVT